MNTDRIYRAKPEVMLLAHSVYDAPMHADDDEVIMQNAPKHTWPGESALEGKIQSIPEFAGRACYQSFDRPNPKTATNQDYLHNILSQRHYSVLEHASVTFYITGVSRSFTHELVRHRHLSPSQLSQRYVPIDEMRVVIPPLVEQAIVKTTMEFYEKPFAQTGMTKADRDKVHDWVEDELENYAKRGVLDATDRYNECLQLLSALGDLPKKQLREAARSKLPNETETRIVITGNFRAWIETLQKRDHPAADREFRVVARMISEQLAGIAPNIFDQDARLIWGTNSSKEQAAPK